MASILVIEDDSAMREAIRLMLLQRGHEIHTAAEGGVALMRLDTTEIDLVITDMLMPGQEGVETIRSLRRRAPTLPILAISGGGNTGFREALEAARLLGANETLSKPFAMRDLSHAVERLLTAPTDPAAAA